MRRCLSLLIVLLAAPLPAMAQDSTWRPSSSSGGRFAMIDTASIVRDGARVRAVREVRTLEPQTFETGARYDRLGALMEFDCAARTARTIRVYARLGDEVIGEDDVEDAVAPVVPGSTADADLRAVCFNEWPTDP